MGVNILIQIVIYDFIRKHDYNVSLVLLQVAIFRHLNFQAIVLQDPERRFKSERKYASYSEDLPFKEIM